MTTRTLANLTLAEIRDMIADGFTDEMILAESDDRHDHEIESEQAADDSDRSYGDDYDDDTREYGRVAEYNDRLTMGQNDAGEWLGFC